MAMTKAIYNICNQYKVYKATNVGKSYESKLMPTLFGVFLSISSFVVLSLSSKTKQYVITEAQNIHGDYENCREREERAINKQRLFD